MAKSGTFSEKFNKAAWSVAKFTLSVAAGFAIGGIVDFTFFHNHPAGKHLVSIFNKPLQKTYDAALNLLGFPEYATGFSKAVATEELAMNSCINDLGDMVSCSV